MDDNDFVQAKLKLDKMTLDLMLMVKQMRELNEIALSLQEDLQNSWRTGNEKADKD